MRKIVDLTVVVAAAIGLWLVLADEEVQRQSTTEWYITTVKDGDVHYQKTDEETCRQAEAKRAPGDYVSCVSYTLTTDKK